jgi:hypothetical protein
MNVHRFAIGQSVILKGTIGMSLQTGHMFRVTGRMPPRDNSPQYRIRNENEWHERVAPEENLEEVNIGPFYRACWPKQTQSPDGNRRTYRRPLARISAIS